MIESDFYKIRVGDTLWYKDLEMCVYSKTEQIGNPNKIYLRASSDFTSFNERFSLIMKDLSFEKPKEEPSEEFKRLEKVGNSLIEELGLKTFKCGCVKKEEQWFANMEDRQKSFRVPEPCVSCFEKNLQIAALKKVLLEFRRACGIT